MLTRVCRFAAGKTPIDPEKSLSKLRVVEILRDVAIIVATSFIATLFFGAIAAFFLNFAASMPRALSIVSFLGFAATIAMAIISPMIGFAISGALVGGKRWKHLWVVAAVLWLLSLFRYSLEEATAAALLSLPIIVLSTIFGGRLSYLLRR